MIQDEAALAEKLDRLCAAVEACQERISKIEQLIDLAAGELRTELVRQGQDIGKQLALLDESARLLLLQSVMNGMDCTMGKNPPDTKLPHSEAKQAPQDDLCLVRVHQKDISSFLQQSFDGLQPAYVVQKGTVMASKLEFLNQGFVKKGGTIATLRNDIGTVCNITAPRSGQLFFLNREKAFPVFENDAIAVIVEMGKTQEEINRLIKHAKEIVKSERYGIV